MFILWLVNSVAGGGNYKCNWSWLTCNAGLSWPTGISIVFKRLTSPCTNFIKIGNNCLWFNHADTRTISCQLSLMAPASSPQKNDTRPWSTAIGSALQNTCPSVDPIMWHTETIASSGWADAGNFTLPSNTAKSATMTDTCHGYTIGFILWVLRKVTLFK